MPIQKTDKGLSNKLIKLIKEVSENVFRRMIRGYPRTWAGKVIETSGAVNQNGNVEIYLNADLSSSPITLKSKTNEVLNANDEVYIFSPTGNLSNAVVLIKK